MLSTTEEGNYGVMFREAIVDGESWVFWGEDRDGGLGVCEIGWKVWEFEVGDWQADSEGWGL